MGDQAPIITRQPVNLENIVVTVQPTSSSMQNILSLQSSFVGREYELEAIEQHFNDPSCRLLTLVGLGGVGKTRLALEAARRIIRFNGAYVVYLQPLTSPEFIIPTIAEALGLQFYAGTEPRQQLLDYLCRSSVLLVLDNFEHLLDGADLLTEILEAATDVRLLVTSRERLNLREEWVLDVGGLPYPSRETDTAIHDFDAIKLFVQHARKVKADFVLTDSLKPTVVHICHLVGGMPLGIELAASWVRVLSCEAIAAEIERSLDILETSARNTLPRHRNMRAVFEPTWERLTEAERQVFAQLSVFRGGFNREAAEQIAGASLRTLTGLVDKSLLRVDANGRYDLHELLRQYGEERLHLAGDMAEQTGDRHCQYYARFLEQCWPRITGSQIKEAFAEIETELDNVRVAWDWAIDRRKDAEIEIALDSLYFFYTERGRYLEGEQALAHAAAAYGEHSDHSVTMRAKIQARQGWMYSVLGVFDKGNTVLRESIAILRQTDAHADLAMALRNLAGFLADNRLAPSEVYDCLEESLNIYTKLNDLWDIAHTLMWLSIFHHREFDRRGAEGALERAEECGLQRLVIYQQLDSVWGIASAYLNLADVAYRRNEYEKCKQYAQKSHDLYRYFGSFVGISLSLMLMGDATVGYKAYDEARRYTAQGLQMPFEFRSPIINFFSLYHLLLAVQIWEGEGQLEKAYELIGLLDQQRQKAPSGLKHHFVFKHLSQLEADLPPNLAAAVERGRQADAETMVKAIIAEFTQGNANDAVATPIAHLSANLLSERELEVLRLVAEGCSNQEIADRLYIGVSTVKKHINHIYDKLEAKNRTQAVAFARERHLL